MKEHDPVMQELATARRDPYEWMSAAGTLEIDALVAAETEAVGTDPVLLNACSRSLSESVHPQADAPYATLPTRFGDWWYFERRSGAAGRRTLYRRAVSNSARPSLQDLERDIQTGAAQIVLDDRLEAGNARYFSRVYTAMTTDGNNIAFLTDSTGNERYTLHWRDLSGRASVVVAAITDVGPYCAVSPSGAFFTRRARNGRPCEIWRLSRDGVEELVFRENDDERTIAFSPTKGGTHLRIVSRSWEGGNAYFFALESQRMEDLVLDGVAGTSATELVRSGSIDWVAVVHHSRNSYNSLDLVPLHAAAIPCQQLVEGSPSFIPEHVDVVGDALVISARVNGKPSVRLLDVDELDSARGNPLALRDALPDAQGNCYAHDNLSPTQRQLLVRVSSFARPTHVVEIDLESRTVEVGADSRASSNVPFEMEEATVLCTVDDQQRVPVSIVRPAGTPSPIPFVLSVYGAYGISTDTSYDPAVIALLQHGIGFGVVHARGGGEFGPSWHKQSIGAKKSRTISDFIGCVHDLIRRGYTKRGLVIAHGSSAGGLTVGSAANREPELFAAVVCDAPFCDPIGALMDPSARLSTTDRVEWGDPLSSAEDYEALRAISPYDTVPEGRSLPKYFISGNRDDVRTPVTSLLKWAARLRDADAEVLLDIGVGGHAGSALGEAARRRDAIRLTWMINAARRASKQGSF